MKRKEARFRMDAALEAYAKKNPDKTIAKLTAKQAAKLAQIKAEKIRTAAGMVC